jgi:hypothetical protein
MEKGEILEKGSYAELINNNDRFSRLMAEYGGVSKSGAESQEEHTADGKDVKGEKEDAQKKINTDAPKALMIEEEREEGAVKWHHYKIYAWASGGFIVWFAVFLFAALINSTRVMNDYWIVWWSTDALGLPRDTYIGFYVMFGGIQAIAVSEYHRGPLDSYFSICI